MKLKLLTNPHPLLLPIQQSYPWPFVIFLKRLVILLLVAILVLILFVIIVMASAGSKFLTLPIASSSLLAILIPAILAWRWFNNHSVKPDGILSRSQQHPSLPSDSSSAGHPA
jgi:hypothetical protein